MFATTSRTSQRSLAFLLAVAMVMAMMVVFAPSAMAWPAPEINGTCDGWYVVETAPDRDWNNTSYWTIDGVDGQFERGDPQFVSDDSDTTEREFTVRWFSDKGKELDARSNTGVRDLGNCEEPPAPPQFSVVGPESACSPWMPELTLNVPEFEGDLFAYFSDGGDAIGRALVSGQNETFGPGEPITGDWYVEVSVEDVNGTEFFSSQMTYSPLSDEDCTPVEAETTVTVTAVCEAVEGEAQGLIVIEAGEGVTVQVAGSNFGPGSHQVNVEPGTYEWTAVADEGFTISGASSGTVTATDDCVEQPEPMRGIEVGVACDTATGQADVDITNTGEIMEAVDFDGAMFTIAVDETAMVLDVENGTHVLSWGDEGEEVITVLVDCTKDQTDLPEPPTTSYQPTPATYDRRRFVQALHRV